MKKVLVLIIAIMVSLSLIASAHPGRTDKNGGHYNRSTGVYHYHNGGYSSSSSSSNSVSSRPAYSEDTKKIQLRLIELGYDPGPADGIKGAKTVSAIKQFQRDSGLTADGVVGRQTRVALKI